MIKECTCPKCGEKITELNFTRTREDSGDLFFEDGTESIDILNDPETIEETYVCPSCGEILFTDFDSAYDFLKAGADKKTEDDEGD